MSSTNPYSGKLSELFPGYAKLWTQYLRDLLLQRGFSDKKRWMYHMQGISHRECIPLLTNELKYKKQLGALGLQVGQPLEKLAEVLRARGVDMTYGYLKHRSKEQNFFAPVITEPMRYLERMEGFLALNSKMVVHNIPVFVELGNSWESSYNISLQWQEELVFQETADYWTGTPQELLEKIAKELVTFESDIGRELQQGQTEAVENLKGTLDCYQKGAGYASTEDRLADPLEVFLRDRMTGRPESDVLQEAVELLGKYQQITAIVSDLVEILRAGTDSIPSHEYLLQNPHLFAAGVSPMFSRLGKRETSHLRAVAKYLLEG